MTTLAYTVPTIGELNTAADVKVDQCFEAIRTWADGNVGTGNIEVGSVTEAMLIAAVQTKLNAKTGAGLTFATSGVSVVAVAGELIEMTGAGATTVTLPAATANASVGAFNRTSGLVKVKVAAGKLFGGFLTSTGVTEVVLTENQHVLVEATGTNWLIVAGEPKREQVYGAVTERYKGESGSYEGEPSATRPTQVILQLEKNNTEETMDLAVTVGGVVLPELSVPKKACPAQTKALYPALTVLPGVKYKATVTASGGATLFSSYLPG